MNKLMMSDTDYQSLQIRASVTPSAESWAQPDFSTASIKGDKPTLGTSANCSGSRFGLLLMKRRARA